MAGLNWREENVSPGEMARQKKTGQAHGKDLCPADDDMKFVERATSLYRHCV